MMQHLYFLNWALIFLEEVFLGCLKIICCSFFSCVSFRSQKQLLRFDFDFDFDSIRSAYRISHLMLSDRWSKQASKGCWWRRARACCANYHSRNAAVFLNANVHLVPPPPLLLILSPTVIPPPSCSRRCLPFILYYIYTTSVSAKLTSVEFEMLCEGWGWL